jgi:hypothetical protein
MAENRHPLRGAPAMIQRYYVWKLPQPPPAKEEPVYGSRARIGYTSPPLVTEVFPYEFYKMAPPGVTLALTT